MLINKIDVAEDNDNLLENAMISVGQSKNSGDTKKVQKQPKVTCQNTFTWKSISVFNRCAMREPIDQETALDRMIKWLEENSKLPMISQTPIEQSVSEAMEKLSSLRLSIIANKEAKQGIV